MKKSVTKNEVFVSDEKGSKIKLIFKEEDDMETAENITLSLLKIYEERMKKSEQSRVVNAKSVLTSFAYNVIIQICTLKIEHEDFA